jgi:hypothetical protein
LVLTNEAVGIPKAQRSGRKHRCEHSPALHPPRCATKPERGLVPESMPFLPIRKPYFIQHLAQHGIAADRFAREIVAF